MPHKQINNVAYLKQRRKDLRSNLTPAETTLWRAIKGSAIGKKFRRQHSLENYIADFYCPDQKLVVELDGAVHDDPIQSAYDEERTKRLNELGYRVIRFKNDEVFNDIIGVLATIQSEFQREVPPRLRTYPTARPSLPRRGATYDTMNATPRIRLLVRHQQRRGRNILLISLYNLDEQI